MGPPPSHAALLGGGALCWMAGQGSSHRLLKVGLRWCVLAPDPKRVPTPKGRWQESFFFFKKGEALSLPWEIPAQGKVLGIRELGNPLVNDQDPDSRTLSCDKSDSRNHFESSMPRLASQKGVFLLGVFFSPQATMMISPLGMAICMTSVFFWICSSKGVSTRSIMFCHASGSPMGSLHTKFV